MMPENNKKKPTSNVKDNILEEALKIFSKFGYQGTSTRMIATAAEVNISALHYYWGDKLSLYQASLIKANKRIHEMHKKVGEKIKSYSLEEKIDISVKLMTDFFLENPEYCSLILNALLIDQTSESEINDEVNESVYKNLSEVVNILHFEIQTSKEQMLELLATTYLFYNLVTGKTYFQRVLSLNDAEYKDYINDITKKRFMSIFGKED
ncbi:transcriptional regulator, TetR family [Dethiosulfatibacter aminovorans DSM 17477]|uniref:Transcriptional regulator, TetR family n=1 Tax=Dethiosulfatibacter aminovorans DSM 17477 TaxID=1121476 RepID=A0A1M6EZ77_9FIRM|nr:TetR/AcrR family transcriptional regulator [Dethiosulfatibacter aminovorans]SHI90742.1 transcriptional regulator, TetR family [Dethiosulfatibacter aminovorans DSM 17477]